MSCGNDKWWFLFRKHNISFPILDFSVLKRSLCTLTAIWFHWNSGACGVGHFAMSFGLQNALVPSRAFEINMKTLIHFNDHSPLCFSTFRQKQRQLATVSYQKKKRKALKIEWLRCLTKGIQFLVCVGLLPNPQAFVLAIPLSRWYPWLDLVNSPISFRTQFKRHVPWEAIAAGPILIPTYMAFSVYQCCPLLTSDPLLYFFYFTFTVCISNCL